MKEFLTGLMSHASGYTASIMGAVALLSQSNEETGELTRSGAGWTLLGAAFVIWILTYRTDDDAKRKAAGLKPDNGA